MNIKSNKTKVLLGLGVLGTSICAANVLTTTNVHAETQNEFLSDYTGKEAKKIETLLLEKTKTYYGLNYSNAFYKDYIREGSLKTIYYKDERSVTATIFKVNYKKLMEDKYTLKKAENGLTLKKDISYKMLESIISNSKNYDLTDDDIDVYIENFVFGNEVSRSIKIFQNDTLILYSPLDTYKVTDRRVASKSTKFTDIHSSWAAEYINKLKDKGIVEGSDGLYNPNKPVTRAQFSAMLARTIPFIDTNLTEDKFTDTKNHWAKDEIALLAEMGVITGYSDGTFKPNQLLTRQQAVAMIDRFLLNVTESKILEKTSTGDIAPYDDEKSISPYAVDSVKRLSTLNIISGSNNQFKPHDNLTRAQMAKILSNVLELNN